VISQAFLLAFSLTGVYFSASKHHRDLRWASVFGLLAQPFWFYQTYTHGQWGIFALSFAFTALYLKGFYIYWLKPEPPTSFTVKGSPEIIAFLKKRWGW
jgi:hypothetical protein